MYQSALPEQSKECVPERLSSCLAAAHCGFENFVMQEVELPETKKRLCPHTWDKSVNFCGTTQIDIRENVHSLTRTIIRAPMDNGWGPVSPY